MLQSLLPHFHDAKVCMHGSPDVLLGSFLLADEELMPVMYRLCNSPPCKQGFLSLQPLAWCNGMADHANTLQQKMPCLAKFVSRGAVSAKILAFFELCKVCFSSSVTPTHQHVERAVHILGLGTMIISVMTHSVLSKHVSL